jgi:hypothetical protein
MLADGADPRVLPAKHMRSLVWLAQRLGQKTSNEDYSTAYSRREVAEFYLGSDHSYLVSSLSIAIDQEIDRIGTAKLSDVLFTDIKL